jgi:hypothetical protein
MIVKSRHLIGTRHLKCGNYNTRVRNSSLSRSGNATRELTFLQACNDVNRGSTEQRAWVRGWFYRTCIHFKARMFMTKLKHCYKSTLLFSGKQLSLSLTNVCLVEG